MGANEETVRRFLDETEAQWRRAHGQDRIATLEQSLTLANAERDAARKRVEELERAVRRLMDNDGRRGRYDAHEALEAHREVETLLRVEEE